MKVYNNLFNQIIEPENLFLAWDIFRRGKRSKTDVIRFERNLEQNIFKLASELRDRSYRHGPYTAFYICDPKLRHVHKATVRDRVLHHAVFRILNLVFDPTFIPTSFSCRFGRGTHKGVKTTETILRRTSQNYTRPCYALQCDIKKFFDSVNHSILFEIINRKIKDPQCNMALEGDY